MLKDIKLCTKTEIRSRSKPHIQKIKRYHYKKDICKVAYMWLFKNRYPNTQMKIFKCLFSQLTPTGLYSLKKVCMIVDQILCKQGSQKDRYTPTAILYRVLGYLVEKILFQWKSAKYGNNPKTASWLGFHQLSWANILYDERNIWDARTLLERSLNDRERGTNFDNARHCPQNGKK